MNDDRLPLPALCGAATYSNGGDLLDANAAMREILDGPAVKTAGIRDLLPREWVCRAVLTTAENCVEYCVATQTVHGGRLDLIAMPVPDGEAVTVLASSRKPVGVDPALVARLYKMSMAPAACASLLCDGLTVEEVAARRGVAWETARKQIKEATRAIGVQSQRELVRVILTGPAAAVAAMGSR